VPPALEPVSRDAPLCVPDTAEMLETRSRSLELEGRNAMAWWDRYFGVLMTRLPARARQLSSIVPCVEHDSKWIDTTLPGIWS